MIQTSTVSNAIASQWLGRPLEYVEVYPHGGRLGSADPHRYLVSTSRLYVRTEGGVARDCFELANPTGSPFSAERLAAIRQTVVDAVRQRIAESA